MHGGIAGAISKEVVLAAPKCARSSRLSKGECGRLRGCGGRLVKGDAGWPGQDVISKESCNRCAGSRMKCTRFVPDWSAVCGSMGSTTFRSEHDRMLRIEKVTRNSEPARAAGYAISAATTSARTVETRHWRSHSAGDPDQRGRLDLGQRRGMGGLHSPRSSSAFWATPSNNSAGLCC